MTRFRLDVTLALQLTLDGDTADEVIGRARDIVGARPGVRSESISSICAMPIPTAHPTMQASNLTYWQESEAIEHGTATQRWQWERGELPAAELADIARSVLFAPLAGFKRRVRMGPSAIKHPTDETGVWMCATGPATSLATVRPGEPVLVPIAWTTGPCSELASWERVVMMRLIDNARAIADHPWIRHVNADVSITARTNKGTCQRCGQTAAETSALVTVPWAGRILSREYAL